MVAGPMPRTKLLAIIVILAALTLTAALPTAALARHRLAGPGYRTFVPSSWTSKHKHLTTGWHRVNAWPRKHSTDDVVMTIGSISAHVLSRNMKQALPSTPIGLVQALTQVPSGALNVQLSAQPQQTTLGGTIAGILELHYRLGSGQNYGLLSTALRRGPRVYVLSLIYADDYGRLAQKGLDMARRTWRWS
jgi:hypothetical protein